VVDSSGIVDAVSRGSFRAAHPELQNDTHFARGQNAAIFGALPGVSGRRTVPADVAVLGG
jgi:hypothetical protein